MPTWFRFAAASTALLALVPACQRAQPSTPATAITIATGRAGLTFDFLGTRLAEIYNRRLPSIRATTKLTGSAEVMNADLVQRGEADIAFVGGDTAYAAYRRGTEADPTPHTRLRGIAVLFSSAVQIVTRRDSQVYRVSDLRNRRLGIGDVQGFQTDAATHWILQAYGLGDGDVRVSYTPSLPEMAAMMRNHELDTGLMFTVFPQSPIVAISSSVAVRLVPIGRREIAKIQTYYPFLKSVTIPRGTYAGQTDDVITVGIDNILMCREDLPQQLVRDLTKTFFEGLPELVQAHTAAKAIDLDQGPATPIPLHPGAALYYRERELAR